MQSRYDGAVMENWTEEIRLIAWSLVMEKTANDLTLIKYIRELQFKGIA